MTAARRDGDARAPDDDALWRAYRATRFEAVVDDASAPIAIRVGECCARLDALLDAHGVAEWVYVTAWNPHSAPLADDDNARRNAELAAELDRFAAARFAGFGRGADASWKPEASFLALGVDDERGVDLGRRFGQNAIVAGRRGEPARLVDCRVPRDREL